MNDRTISLGLGTAITTFLLAGATTIELLGAGEAPGIGIIGIFVDIIASIFAGVIASVYADRCSGIVASALVAYATFGVAFVAIVGMRYVNVPSADEVLTFPVHIGASIVLAVVVALLTIRRRSGERATST